MKERRRSLIIAPHPDDEILSFGGYIDSELKKGNEVKVVFMTCGGPRSKASAETRKMELQSVMEFLGVEEYLIAFENYDGLLDTFPNSELTMYIDEQIEEYKPGNIVTCYPSTHVDHIATYNAFQASMRLKEGHLPNLVAFGEYPFILPSLEVPAGGKMYLPLSEKSIERKCQAFQLYKSQQKPSPSPLGVEGIRILAKTRGLECGHEYAEMYYLQKLTKRLV